MFQIFTHEQIDELNIANDSTVEWHKTPEHRKVCRSNLMGYIAEGNVVCKSRHVLVKQIPAKMQNLRFREKELIETIENIMNGERLVMLLGLHGVGKSSVAKNTLHFIYERKYMTGGVLWVQLKGVKDVYSAMKQIQSYIYKSLILSKDEVTDLIRETCTEKDLLSFIISFFNNSDQQEY